MEFSLYCNYYSYVMGAQFPMWFSCTCLKPEHLAKMKEMQAAEGQSLFVQRALYALHYGDCRLSYRGGGSVVFDGHEFTSAAEGENVRIRFDDECQFVLTSGDAILYV